MIVQGFLNGTFLLLFVSESFTCCEKEKEGFLLICFPENFWFCLWCLLVCFPCFFCGKNSGELRRFVLMTEKVLFGCVIVPSCLFVQRLFVVRSLKMEFIFFCRS